MLSFLSGTVGVSTISLSLSSLTSNINSKLNQTPENLQFDIADLCERIKSAGFNLRLSLNMNCKFHRHTHYGMFMALKSRGADQVTFRKLYTSSILAECIQDKWIEAHEYKGFDSLNAYIKKNGRPLERLPFGAMRYSVHGISTVVDDDCMSTEVKDTMKYLILRPNCKLYTKWDDNGSLLF